jgi:DNA replication protein DnaC
MNAGKVIHAMRHIGDVLKELSIPITPRGSSSRQTEPVFACNICHDAGFYQLDVPIDHPQFGQLQKCSCRKGVEEERKGKELLRLSNLDMMSHLSFAQFDSKAAGVGDAYTSARNFAESPDGWLLLKGPYGSGKTHLAVAVALEIMDRYETPVLFMVVPDLLDHLRSTFDPSSGVGYDERFEQVRTAPILVLDDLGTENATPWAREKLYQVFNYRYNERLPIVVTTNAELRPGANSAKTGQSGQIDERIRSRLLDEQMTVFVEMSDAEDYRLRGRPAQLRQLRR